jgi:hypothetical protein
MTAVRLAQASAAAPHPDLQAIGHVAVNGNGSVGTPDTSFLRLPDPVTPPKLSPARKAWSDHLKTVDQLTVAVNHMVIPADHLEQKLKDALARLSVAEARQTETETAFAATISEALMKGEEVPSAPALDPAIQSAVAQARSDCNSYRLALAEHRAEQARRTAMLEQAKGRDRSLMLDILEEFHRASVDRWAEARDTFYAREAELYGLHELVGIIGRRLNDAHGDLSYLRKLETLRPPWAAAAGHVELGEKQVNAAADRWAEVLRRLQQGEVGATL